MQLIRKVDWFDGTSGAGLQSALVCEGVHAQVDIYAFQGSFNINIKGSMKKRRLPLFFLFFFPRVCLPGHEILFQIKFLVCSHRDSAPDMW